MVLLPSMDSRGECVLAPQWLRPQQHHQQQQHTSSPPNNRGFSLGTGRSNNGFPPPNGFPGFNYRGYGPHEWNNSRDYPANSRCDRASYRPDFERRQFIPTRRSSPQAAASRNDDASSSPKGAPAWRNDYAAVWRSEDSSRPTTPASNRMVMTDEIQSRLIPMTPPLPRIMVGKSKPVDAIRTAPPSPASSRGSPPAGTFNPNRAPASPSSAGKLTVLRKDGGFSGGSKQLVDRRAVPVPAVEAKPKNSEDRKPPAIVVHNRNGRHDFFATLKRQAAKGKEETKPAVCDVYVEPSAEERALLESMGWAEPLEEPPLSDEEIVSFVRKSLRGRSLVSLNGLLGNVSSSPSSDSE